MIFWFFAVAGGMAVFILGCQLAADLLNAFGLNIRMKLDDWGI